MVEPDVARSRIAEPLAGAANVADEPRSPIPATVIAAIKIFRMSFLLFEVIRSPVAP
jgi:hypothetical protein